MFRRAMESRRSSAASSTAASPFHLPRLSKRFPKRPSQVPSDPVESEPRRASMFVFKRRWSTKTRTTSDPAQMKAPVKKNSSGTDTSSPSLSPTSSSYTTSLSESSSSSTSPNAPLSIEDVWATGDIDIGITNVLPPRKEDRDRLLQYEISLRFPEAGRLWRVRRSVREFASLHASLHSKHSKSLAARSIQLPQTSWLSMDWIRASTNSHSPSPLEDPATLQMLLRLNTYLRRLLELDQVHEDTVFRDFLTPRPTSPNDMELCSMIPPSIGITPTASAKVKVRELHRLKSLESPAHVSLDKRVISQCTNPIHFGATIQFQALGGLRVGLSKRSTLSGGQKAVTVAAGVAGFALTGPLSAMLTIGALSGGYQLNKALYLSVDKSNPGSFMNSQSTDKGAHGSFVIENAELVSGPRRALKYGDLIHLYCRNVRKSIHVGLAPDSKNGHVQIAYGDTAVTTLRLVSPYGDRGQIVCGSQVFLQALDGPWAGEFIGIEGEVLSTGASASAFKICIQDHACHATEQIVPLTRGLPLRPYRLRVMVYNVWMLPSILNSFSDKISPLTVPRSQAIPHCIAMHDIDVVIFCEAFCSTGREGLIKGMKAHGFLYETKVVGTGASVANKKAIDGGVFAMSKYPIEHYEELTFGSVAVGDDRMADKGVIYFQTRVKDEVVHVFGTHLQAWESKVAIAARKQQLKTIRDFMESMKISPEEPVLIAGDLNVDNCADDATEYKEMLVELNAEDPELLTTSSAFSFDPLTNKLAVSGPSSGGRTERLDYVLFAKHHRQPVESSMEIVPLKASVTWGAPSAEDDHSALLDLSDHYPVVCDLKF
ncbi:hypothetical protein Poli38472_010431 [Pythium oligandrum]|uniref:sphingomyelin phosphodiesterase n=1 Tax=Pythium oligandrum TaxID=41045 RepID=A0A8K1C352_PYTOL|nr:hypothetical protein Poli38472_010431 [Pythium oligandrum]|eukprot:TMW55549.1 hypothetical protein Poli38472_010431 [Pythium oligandrum]